MWFDSRWDSEQSKIHWIRVIYLFFVILQGLYYNLKQSLVPFLCVCYSSYVCWMNQWMHAWIGIFLDHSTFPQDTQILERLNHPIRWIPFLSFLCFFLCFSLPPPPFLLCFFLFFLSFMSSVNQCPSYTGYGAFDKCFVIERLQTLVTLAYSATVL